MSFPRHGKNFPLFSTVWKKVFHGVEKFYGATGLRGGGRYIFKEIGNDFLTGGAGVGYNGWREKVLPRLG